MRAIGRFRGEVRLDGSIPGLNILAGPNDRHLLHRTAELRIMEAI